MKFTRCGGVHERTTEKTGIARGDAPRPRNGAVELCAEQISTSGLPVTHSIKCDEIVLDLGQLVPVALIVSELITNSLKHAFRGRDGGHISVSFTRCSNSSDVELVVSDDGAGCITSEPGQSRSIGRKIISGLAAQLSAHVTYTNGTGTTAALRFPLRNACKV